MKMLVLGGTRFLGRHLVDAARARGHRPTLFNRGRSAPGLYPDIERLRGEREDGLEAPRGRTWDAVIDTCGYLPRLVRRSAGVLRDAVGRCLAISLCRASASTRIWPCRSRTSRRRRRRYLTCTVKTSRSITAP